MKKTAIITGASRGIGLETAKQLGTNGYNVVIVASRPVENYAESLKELEKDNIEYLYVQADISKQEDREKIVREAVEKYKEIHVLVNNAGVAPKVRNDLLEMTEDSFDYVAGINIKGTLFLTQLVAKQMISQPITGKKRGDIINVSSCSAVVSSVNRGEYCISKASISMMTTLFADRLAQEQIYVNEVRPGVIKTDMTSAVNSKYDKLIEDGIFPIARWGTPLDVANAIKSLCSDNFLYTTGNYIDIDGGFHIKKL